MTNRLAALALTLCALNALASCKGPESSPAGTTASGNPVPGSSEAMPKPNPDRNAYYGETHLHTSWSVDAWIIGTRITGPGEAYKYAQGEPIKHAMGFDMKIDEPLDFMGVTDHSEYVGVTKEANTPGSAISKMPEAQPLILHDPNSAEEQQKVFLYLLTLASKPPIKAFMSPEVAGTIWKENVKLADENNHPGKFTAFCSYEFTAMPNNRNMHRNIFFRDCAKVPAMPFSSLDSWHPEDLWKWMDAQRKAGNELLSIGHNPNLSDGWFYPTDLDSYGRPIDAAWADDRIRNERLVEIKQIKGQSETHPLLSPNDEFAGYEIFSGLLGLPPDIGRIDRVHGSFVRQAWKDGITMQDVRGFNPYKFGMAGGSDSHNSASPYRQDNFFGGHGEVDGSVQRRFAGVMLGNTIDVRLENPGGLTGVWAEENTRASIFDGMYRKETFGVSGPHMKVRFFGGWSYATSAFDAKDWVHQSYANGVPMGADLPPKNGMAPTFVVWAVKDPTSGNLDRIQVIKGWTKNGQSFEHVYDVVWAGDRKKNKWTGKVPGIQNTVDLETATYTNSVGATELKTVWTDPDFDASLYAFYYARVLEIPTPRWTLIQAVKAHIPPPDVVPLTGQERAWTSPIWYTPTAEARKGEPAGTTVADLKKKGATQLGDAQLKALVVGKAFWVRNNVTGDQFSVAYTAEGQSITWHVGRTATLPSSVGNPVRDGYEGVTTGYKIEGGKVTTTISQDPFSFTVYKLGDIYYGARSNEFGFANYQMIPTPQIVINPLEAISEQFAIELGLTEQQRAQIEPMVVQSLKDLGAIKDSTSLDAMAKARALVAVSKAMDAKVTPLLNADQQTKFQAMRRQMRRDMIEQIGHAVRLKLEAEMKDKF